MPSYQSFSGSDITATFGGRVIGELLSINWSVTREKAPNYTMGFKNPRGFARGRRGIAGSLVFGVFDRNALLAEMRKGGRSSLIDGEAARYYSYKASSETGERFVELPGGRDLYQPESFNDMMSRTANNQGLLEATEFTNDVEYADQLMPFDITVNFVNETGARAKLTLTDVEILNQGMGVSVDDLATSQNYTFVCRDIQELTPVDRIGNRQDKPSTYNPDPFTTVG
jgi:hypothetical protein